MIHIRRADFESVVRAMEELNRTISKASSNAETPEKSPKPKKKASTSVEEDA